MFSGAVLVDWFFAVVIFVVASVGGDVDGNGNVMVIW